MAKAPKDNLLPQSNGDAVHFLDRSEWKAGEILCGYAVTYKRSAAELRDAYTEDKAAVTCRECATKLKSKET